MIRIGIASCECAQDKRGVERKFKNRWQPTAVLIVFAFAKINIDKTDMFTVLIRINLLVLVKITCNDNTYHHMCEACINSLSLDTNCGNFHVTFCSGLS